NLSSFAGYGNIAPRTALGRIVTVAYAFFGIPLTLVYLSSTGSILAKVAREVFSKALCCCLCSNCGYCCYDEKRMAEKERRMKRKRQQEELQTPTSLVLKDYVNHELVPILTMDPNGSRLGLAQPTPAYSPAAATAQTTGKVNPVETSAIHGSESSLMGYTTTLSSPLLESQSQSQATGQVYTLAEETEIELQAVHTEIATVERI
ncbi:GH12835, partial [Drosophila grimshawi]